MSFRFIIGRAGSGKTWRCLEEIRRRLRESAVDGSRLLWIVPEQASFQAERALIETPDIPGFVRCEVLSFRRLAHRVFAETGIDPRRTDETIGGFGRLMVMRRLLRRERHGLRLLAGVADRPGLVKQLSTSIDELMREDVDPRALDELAGRVGDDEPLQASRLADLSRIYRAYREYLADGRLDPAEYLALASQRIALCTSLQRSEVWVDGFAGLTAQEYHLLVQLARVASSLEMTLLVDPDAAAVTSDKLPPLSLSLFTRTERTLVRLRQALREAGVAEDPPIRLHEAPRFRSPDLAALEAGVFHDRSARSAAPGGAVQVFELPDRRSEVEATIAEIQRLTLGPAGMRYRDIAVIVRDLTEYHDLVSSAMRAHGIPCFIDRREPTTHHPLVELVRGLLSIAADDCRMESVRLLLKTGLLPIARSNADLLENYILACGIEGWKAWQAPWTSRRFFARRLEDGGLYPWQQTQLAKINTLREGWCGAVGAWMAAAREPGEVAGRNWAERLYACLNSMKTGRRLMKWAEQAEDAGRADEADMHRQVWQDFVELLDEFVRALGNESMPLSEFRETLEAGLAEFSLGLAPPTLDQVLVSAIERSRHPAVRAVFILGFDEAHFPLRRSQDPLLGDAERDRLEEAGIQVGPSRRRQLLDERMLAYIGLTRASDRLWISYPRAGSDGKPVQPSPYLQDIRDALPGLEPVRIGDPRIQRQPLWIARVGELGGRLARELRTRPPLEEDTAISTRAAWNALYTTAIAQNDWRYTLRGAMAGLAYRNGASLESGLIAQAIESPFVASVSRLESFAKCPFAHFLDAILRLEERAEAELDEMDLGSLCHDVLERFIDALVKDRRRLGELEDDQIAERIEAVAQAILPDIEADLLLGTPRNRFLFDRSREHLRRSAAWQRDAARVGGYSPRWVELPFGYSGKGCAPLTLRTPQGRTIYLRGRIDRVDVAELGGELVGMLIDYKRTTFRRLDLTEAFYGIALQLVAYLLTLEQIGESLTGRPIRPAGAVYVPLLENYQTVSHPSDETSRGFKARGILSSEHLQALDQAAGPSWKSAYWGAQLTKDGRPHANSDVARPDEFKALMRHIGKRMGELADAILDGCIDIKPYRLRRHLPCAWCAYKPVCRFELENDGARNLQPIRGRQMLEDLAGGKNG